MPEPNQDDKAAAEAASQAAILKLITDTVATAIGAAEKRYAKQIKAIEDKLPLPTSAPAPDPESGDKTKPDPQTAKLLKQVEALTTKLEATEKARVDTELKAEEKDRHSQIRSALSRFQFAGERAAEAAFLIFRDQVRRSDDGSLVGGDDAPLSQFFDEAMKSHEYLLAPKQTGGAGAVGGSSSRSKSITLDEIKPGMTKEQEAAAVASISHVLGR